MDQSGTAPQNPAAVGAMDRGYQAIFEQSPLPKFVCDPDTLAIREVNNAAVKRYGYSRDEFLQMEYSALSDPGALARLRGGTPLPGGGRRVVGVRHRTRDGESLEVDVASHLVVLNGRPALLIVVTDLTERVRAERALQESEARFRLIADAAPAFIWTVDATGHCTFLNRAWMEYTGRGPHEELGTGWMNGVHPDDLPLVLELYDRLLRDRQGLDFEYRVRRHDGVYRWNVAREAPWYDANGTFLGLVGSGLDIHDRKEAEAALQRLNDELEERIRQRTHQLASANQHLEKATRHKSEFLAGMSHELRSPLNGIIGFAELLRDGKGGPVTPKQVEYLGDLLNSANHLLRLVSDVLDLSAVEAGKLQFYPEKVDVKSVVDEVCHALGPLAERRKLSITRDIDNGLRKVITDSKRLKQVLFNYLSNAVEHTPAGGRIDVRATAADSRHFRIEVADTGVGIRAEDMPRLFKDFEQLRADGVNVSGGSGLGLSLTRRIVEAQGGEVGVESIHGKGSRFYATLPRDLGAQLESAPAPD